MAVVSRAITGNVSTTGATVAVLVSGTGVTTCRLQVSTNSGMTSPAYGSLVALDAQQYAMLPSPVLAPDTPYWYRIEIQGTVDTGWTGTFRTAPTGVKSFSFVFGSCMKETAIAANLTAMANQAPAFTLCLGDLTYGSSGSSDESFWLGIMETLLANTNVKRLLKAAPFVRVWDDHDFGVDNSNGSSPSKPAVASVHRRVFPSYPLPDAVGCYHAFTWGRVRFLMLDSRYSRDSNGKVDTASKTFLGATQKQWLKDQLVAFQADASLALCVIGNPQCWIASTGSPYPTTDSWGKYTFERAELANYIKANVTKQVVQVAGDMHALALDDGTNAVFGTAAAYAQPMVVAQAAAWDYPGGNTKGGPYSKGAPSTGGNRWGRFTITDNTTSISCTIDLFAGSASDVTAATVVFTHTWEVGAVVDPPPPPPPPPPPGASPFWDRTGHRIPVVDASGHAITVTIG